MGANQYLNTVTDHAVMRYVQRVLHVVVPLPRETSTFDRALRHAEAVGLSVNDVKRLILTPPVMIALNSGGSHHVRCGRRKVVVKDGAILTILESKPRRLTGPESSNAETELVSRHRARLFRRTSP